MLLKLSRIYNYSFRVSNNYLKIINVTRICGFKTFDSEFKRLSEKDLTPIDAEDNEIQVGNIIHKSRLNRMFRPHDADFYLRLINKAAEMGDLKKLISIFFHDMILVDRFRPSAYMVNIILKHLANLGGHSESAFKIIKKSLDIKMELTDVTYSLLFKNCSKEIANNELVYQLSNNVIQLVSNEELEKIRQPAMKALEFVDQMKLKDISMKESAMNSLLLVLNKAGMIKESSRLLDEFLSTGYKPTSYTLCAMLEGCLFDRKRGFGIALLIFNKLVHQYKCPLDEHVFNTVLKIARYCQFGNREIIERVIDSSKGIKYSFQTLVEANPESTELLQIPHSNVIHYCPDNYKASILNLSNKFGLVAADHFIEENWSHSNNSVNYFASPTNMLKRRYDNIFAIQWLQSNLTSADKLACLGGILGFVHLIEKSNCKLNQYILTNLVTCLPFTNLGKIDPQQNDFYLDAVIQIAKHFKLDKLSSFRNVSLFRNSRLGVNSSSETIEISKFDPLSWVSYSRKCKNSDDVKKFLYLLKRNEIVVSGLILLSLLRSVVTWDARSMVLNRMKKSNIDLDRSTVVYIEDLIDKFRKKLTSNEAADELNEKNVEAFNRFQRFYAQMLDMSNVESVSTGERKIIIDDIPKRLKER